MNPREPEILNELLRHAETVMKRPRADATMLALLDELEVELWLLRDLASDGERLIDDTAPLLVRCLINLERQGPLGGELVQWQMLARSFLPFVKTLAARGMDLANRPATSDHDFNRRPRR